MSQDFLLVGVSEVFSFFFYKNALVCYGLGFSRLSSGSWLGLHLSNSGPWAILKDAYSGKPNPIDTIK
ncbi:hypothetical protein CEXT_497781 [Caerostris extrusa]|uniref:Uncharacterized protein n=1 Tax=Caerostris extrusa TaxID=172846 RepID=A0AAV4TUI7_CAEEX|nr:hypothetical protein CEXT_497781 [Caerostris extrusa]